MQSIISALEAAPLPQILIDGDERVVGANALARGIFGPAIVGRHYIVAIRQPTLLDAIESVLSGVADRAEAQYLGTRDRRNTTYRVVVGRVAGIDPARLLVSFLDVTDMQEAVQMRRDFVANVSHELRTPLTALLGFIETLRGRAKNDPEAQARFLEIMAREATRMNRLVNDLLSLNRVEGEERVRPEAPVDLAAIIRSAVSSLRPLAEERGAVIAANGAEEACLVRGDADQLSQVMANLIENAIKYGGGRVDIALARAAREPLLRGPAAIVTVADDGDGFDPVHIPRLTERFYRIDTHRSREMGGTGLGLAIVKHIVGRHRGRLRIDSEPGKGSRFNILIPAIDGDDAG